MDFKFLIYNPCMFQIGNQQAIIFGGEAKPY
jgi:hypothetical protein